MDRPRRTTGLYVAFPAAQGFAIHVRWDVHDPYDSGRRTMKVLGRTARDETVIIGMQFADRFNFINSAETLRIFESEGGRRVDILCDVNTIGASLVLTEINRVSFCPGLGTGKDEHSAQQVRKSAVVIPCRRRLHLRCYRPATLALRGIAEPDAPSTIFLHRSGFQSPSKPIVRIDRVQFGGRLRAIQSDNVLCADFAVTATELKRHAQTLVGMAPAGAYVHEYVIGARSALNETVTAFIHPTLDGSRQSHVVVLSFCAGAARIPRTAPRPVLRRRYIRDGADFNFVAEVQAAASALLPCSRL